MKAVMMSIRPQFVAKILNQDKTIEIRKKFPSDYVGWVYIYCTKTNYLGYISKRYIGKVVARFWCNKVDDYVNGRKWSWKSGCPMWGACNDYEYILKDCCLTEDELYDYCEDLSFKAIHITNLEIFDKPKEISEFCSKIIEMAFGFNQCVGKLKHPIHLTKAPQSWQYIEIGE